MDARTLTLADFLLARIAEDEAVARTNTDHFEYAHWDTWSVERQGDRAFLIRQAAPGPSFRKSARITVPHHARELLEQLAHWDPARVLAECQAKRRLVELHTPSADHAEGHCPTCWNDERGCCETLRLLALPYADHPDYRAEWRPTVG